MHKAVLNFLVFNDHRICNDSESICPNALADIELLMVTWARPCHGHGHPPVHADGYAEGHGNGHHQGCCHCHLHCFGHFHSYSMGFGQGLEH